MAKDETLKVKGRDLPRAGAAALPGRNRAWHMDRDPNDPRRNVPAEPNLSKLNEEDPEKAPEFQNPVV